MVYNIWMEYKWSNTFIEVEVDGEWITFIAFEQWKKYGKSKFSDISEHLVQSYH